MGLFKRDDIYYGRVKNDHGRWISRTLNTSDLVVAKHKYTELERREAIPAYRAANAITLGVAGDEFLTSRRVKGCAEATFDMYDVKLRHLYRFFGKDTPLAQVNASKVDKYIVQRLQEGAKRNTIGKELTVLRGLLKVAKRAHELELDLDRILPTEWSNNYEPRRTALTPDQVTSLVEYLATPKAWKDALGRSYQRQDDGSRMNRAAFVAFTVATGARKGEALRAERKDVDLKRGLVHFFITKTRKSGKREKYVPVTPLTRGLLEQAMAATVGRPGRLFDPWVNVIRDLAAACEALGLPKVTPNDLRRTHANWLREAGVDTSTIADVMGHMDGRMVERVYGRLRPDQLRDRVLAVVVGVH